MTPTRPIMRYYGGKWRLAPWIISHFPAHRVYVEPFAGAGSVFLRKPRTAHTEVLNDLSGEVVNVFRVLRSPYMATELERVLRLTPFAREELEAAYAKSDDPVERARRTLVRAFQGFGSMGSQEHNDGFRRTGFRASAMRSGASPANDWDNYPLQIPLFSDRLRKVLIESVPASDIIERFDAADSLFYVDPPYLPETRCTDATVSGGNKGGVYFHEMNDNEHVALAQQLHGVLGMVVISGYHSELYDELFAGWERVETNSRAILNLPRTEVLWLSPSASAALHPRLFA